MEDVGRIRKYIAEEAPIIIHFNLQKTLNFFIVDGLYKNLFEVNTSNGLNNKDKRQ